MKTPFHFYQLALLAGTIVSLGAAGCSKSSSASPSPTHAKLAIRRLQTDGTTAMAYVQFRRLDAGDAVLLRVGGNSDSYANTAETTPDEDVLTGQYSFRVWYPEVVANPAYPITPPPRGKMHADLLVNGQVKASIDLDALHPTFERDTCSRTITLTVQ